MTKVELGEHQQARQLNEDTLTRCRWVPGKEHPHTLNSASNLATVLHALGEHEQAGQLEEYGRAHRKEVSCEDQPGQRPVVRSS